MFPRDPFVPENLPLRRAEKDLSDRFERAYIARAAKDAELDYENFFEKMKKHGSSKRDFKD